MARCGHHHSVGLALALVALAAAPRLPAQTLTAELTDGLRFRSIGPATMSGRIVDLAVVESDPTTFYIASATGGVWKTTNNGVTVTPVFYREATHSVGAIAVHQVHTNVVWVGTGERANRQSSSWGDGVYRSTNGGRTWTNMGLRDTHHIGRIALHPTDPDIVYVAAMGHLWGPNEERGLYLSEDGGETWTRTLFVDEHTGVVDVAVDSHDPSVVYAATYQRRRRPFGFHGGGPGSGLYQSTDGGRHWRRLTAGLPEGDIGRIGISIYRSDPRIVVVSVEQGWQYDASTAYAERRAGIYRSEDRGETWRHMSDWNPRPMYASQPLIDPNDDQRIYMMNSFSYSDNGGETFQTPAQALHGDDRLVWVDPNDSRHVMKADDGGVGISYDRAQTWLYLTHLPVSQFYRVSADVRDPYWIYGGLQDNGSWMGPSATYYLEGIRFEDWYRTGGGDGFVNLVDTTDNRTLYTESQFLGLSRLDLVTHQETAIRPGDPRGAISDLRNWDAWGPDVPEPELGNVMAPANWDGPFIISPHDNHTLYAGTNQLWRSTDRGLSWTSLGDLTTGVRRRDLTIMGRRAHDSTLSLDDGVPYYPTLTAIAESPLRPGLLYVGTDDGSLQVSRDDGANWTNVADRLPGAPRSGWISGIEPSRHAEGTVYVAVNNYRNDDFGSYLYRSTDRGATWQSLVGDLPDDRVLRTVREDPRNPHVLYLGTELGVFYTNDGGAHWIELEANLPTVAVNDLMVHPRGNDLILGTHGRGIWILDNVNALQELTPEVLGRRAHLFSVEPARQIRLAVAGGHTGNMVFRGENPPAGAVIDYYLREATSADSVRLVILDASGTEVTGVRTTSRVGMNRTLWNLRHANPFLAGTQAGQYGGGAQGPWVLPGVYTARLTVGSEQYETSIAVEDDPRIDVTDPERAAWHDAVTALAELMGSFTATVNEVSRLSRRLEELSEDERSAHAETLAELDDLLPPASELRRRLARLYSQVNGWPAPLTADQESQLAYYADWVARLMPRLQGVLEAEGEPGP